MTRQAQHSTPVGGAHPLLAEVQQRLDEDIDLAALAERFGYSPFHFHRMFTKGVGETPRAHIARLRLEKAFLLVAVTNATFLDIALAVGFKNPETFTRAFRRQFGRAPRELRSLARAAERRQPERRADAYTLSDVRFVRLAPMHMLAVRRIGPYTNAFPPPFTEADADWTGIAAWAEARGIGYSRLAYGFFLDMPGITPEAAMRADFCIEIDREVESDGRYFHARFEGGEFGVIEHRGSYDTLPLAYRVLVNAIMAVPQRYVLNGAPPFQIHREVHAGGDPDANLTEVYFPVARV